MKKASKSKEWKAYLRHRNRPSQRRKFSFLNIQNESDSTSPARIHWQYRCYLPEELSFVDNPEGMLELYDTLKQQAILGKNIIFSFKNTKRMTNDAIAFLVAAMKTEPLSSTNHYGNLPEDPKLLQKLIDTKFLDYVNVRKPLPQSTNAVAYGAIQSKKDSNSLEEVVDWGMKKMFGGDKYPQLTDRLKVLLVECMINTTEWAGVKSAYKGEIIRKNNPIPWIVNAHYDEEKDKLCVAFLDFGIGMLETIKRKAIRTILEVIQKLSAGDILKNALMGVYGSSSGELARGGGFLIISGCYEQNFVRRLVVISNDGYIDLNRGSGTMTEIPRKLASPFKGTFIYFEVDRNNGTSRHDVTNS